MAPSVAEVACRQLGFKESMLYLHMYIAAICKHDTRLRKHCMLTGSSLIDTKHTYGQGDGPIIANIACNGTEDHLLNCLFNINHGCVHDNDIVLRCSPGKMHEKCVSV